MEEPDPRLWQAGDADKTRSHGKEGQPHRALYTICSRGCSKGHDSARRCCDRTWRAGELTPIWVPDAAHEAFRTLVWAREAASFAECSSKRSHSFSSSAYEFLARPPPVGHSLLARLLQKRAGGVGAESPRPCAKQITGLQPISQQRRCGSKRTLSEFCNSLLARARQKA
jgi:hypothetical protein